MRYIYERYQLPLLIYMIKDTVIADPDIPYWPGSEPTADIWVIG